MTAKSKGRASGRTSITMSLAQSYSISNESQQDARETIPIELQQLSQWVGCGPDKAPMNAHTGTAASSTDPHTWSTFSAAVERFALVGFVFSADDPFFFIDLDHCRDAETGEVEPWALATIQRFPTYWEVSQSGTGLHGIGYGTLINPGNRKGNIEVYDQGRYGALTGNVVPGCETIRNCQRELIPWHNEIWPVEPARKAPPAPRAQLVEVGDRPTNNRVLEAATSRRNGAKVRRVYDGDTGGYGSDSEADAGLAALLAPYTDDNDQLAEIMRASGLYRDKWDRKGDDYLARTIKFVRKHQSWWWDWNNQRERLVVDGVDQETGEILESDDTAGSDCGEMVVQLKQARQTIRELKRDRSVLIELVLNPCLTDSQKKLLVRTTLITRRKTPEADGYVPIKPGELSNDWRPKAERGQNTPPLNPDGSKPLMSRGSVSGTMKKLTSPSCRFIDARPESRMVQPKDREPYSETVWLVKQPTSIADFLEPAATYSTEPRRKLRAITPPCPDCGEIHARTVQTTTEYICHGCGSSWSETGPARVEQPIIQIGPADTGTAPMSENTSPITPVYPTANRFTPKEEEPDHNDALTLRMTHTGDRQCWECHGPLEDGQTTLCRACSAASRRRVDQMERAQQAGTRPCVDCGEPTSSLQDPYCHRHMHRGDQGMVAS